MRVHNEVASDKPCWDLEKLVCDEIVRLQSDSKCCGRLTLSMVVCWILDAWADRHVGTVWERGLRRALRAVGIMPLHEERSKWLQLRNETVGRSGCTCLPRHTAWNEAHSQMVEDMLGQYDPHFVTKSDIFVINSKHSCVWYAML